MLPLEVVSEVTEMFRSVEVEVGVMGGRVSWQHTHTHTGGRLRLAEVKTLRIGQKKEKLGKRQI